MTLKTALMAACVALLTTGASAKTLTLSAGDHKDFTRIVVPLPTPNAKWTLSETNQGYLLFMPGENIQFDQSNIFRKISRERLSTVQNGKSGQLEFGLGCNCEISSFLWQDRFLILDIRESREKTHPAKVQNPFRITVQPQQSREITGLYSGGIEVEQPEFRLPLAAKPEPATGSLELTNSLQRKSLKSEKTALLNGVLKATSHGLLTPQKIPAEQRKTDVAQTTVSAEKSAKSKSDPLKNLSVRNVVDQEFETARAHLSAQPARQCISDSRLSIAIWSNGDPFELQIAGARMKLVDDLQEPSPNAVVSLAKIYIHFGFGAEAVAALSILEPPDLDSEALSVIARTIDGYETFGQNPLIGMQECATAAAMWALLSSPSGPTNINVNTNAVLTAFLDLPIELRKTIAGPLSQKLIAANEEATARQVLHINSQYGAEPSAETDLAQAEIELTAGEFEAAEPILQDIALQAADSSPTALARLITTQFENGTVIDPELAAIADAFSIEYRDLEEGPSIRHAHILARASNQEYFKSFQSLTESRDLDDAELWTDALQKITLHTTQNSTNETFLRIALNELSDKRSYLNPETVNAVAQRLHLLGLNEEAANFAALGAEGAIGRDRRLLRANISLAAGNPKQAEAHLLGLSGEDVDELRAKARLAAGDLSKAQDIYASLGATDAADKLAWRNGDWPGLQHAEQPLYQKIANLMLADTFASDNSAAPTLAENRALLKTSEDTRRNLDEILQGFQFDSALRQEN